MSETNHLRHIENIILLRNTPLFSGLAPSQLQRIAMTLKEHKYGKGQKILEKGERVTSLMILKEGSCSIGTEILETGMAIKTEAVFVPSYVLDHDGIAQEESIVVTLDQSELYEMLNNNPGTALRLIESLALKIVGNQ